MPPKQPVQDLLRLVWDNCNEVKGHSWTRLNGSMNAALRLAIESAFKFAPDDFEMAYKSFRGERWFGENLGERFYTCACENSNKSAAIAYEAFRERKPFIYDEDLCNAPHGGGSSGGRIYVGRRFAWANEYVTCTSIADDGLSLTACGYDGTDRTPKRRFRITHEDLAKVRKALSACVTEILTLDAVTKPVIEGLAAKHGVPEYVLFKYFGLWEQSKAGKAWAEKNREKRKEAAHAS